ncbi:hypothetical protein [Pseudonocardia abyssalis]|uniref:Uncharacterized protein n=1 Tax=Pseudonocardia abyssalis TaxID=2792008 RepID=A0ABS6USM2_9PSEU|nr:hypothetical protein [Pseudonocardia abyssalis]MBW0117500.1 hypothetical protein [Pseudonocardia abyssalis]MBW0135262.1 hypothetical protein [Pseudonocardia abyssalis]
MTLRSILGVSVAACVLLAGCGSPAPAASVDAAPPPVTADARAPAVDLPWPGRSAAESAGLQQAVDDGAQPWLLDPAELARSYASAAYGWDSVTATATGDSVELTGPGGVRRVLTVAQPGRTGSGGIWVVTADSAE